MFDKFMQWHIGKYKCRPPDGVTRYAGVILEANTCASVVGMHRSSKKKAHELLAVFWEETVSGDPAKDAKNLVKAGYSTPNGARILVMSYPKLVYDDAIDLMIAANEVTDDSLQNTPHVL